MDCSFLFTDFINKDYLPHAAQVHGWMPPPHARKHMHAHPCNPYVPPTPPKHTHTYAYRLICTHIHSHMSNLGTSWVHDKNFSVWFFYCFFHTLGCSMKNKLTVLRITSWRFATNTYLSRKTDFSNFYCKPLWLCYLACFKYLDRSEVIRGIEIDPVER